MSLYANGLQARELKSVYLKARGVFMKLLIHKCYINPLNLFNQVREGPHPPSGLAEAQQTMPMLTRR